MTENNQPAVESVPEEPAEAASELGTVYHAEQVPPLPKPEKEVDFSDAVIDLESLRE